MNVDQISQVSCLRQSASWPELLLTHRIFSYRSIRTVYSVILNQVLHGKDMQSTLSTLSWPEQQWLCSVRKKKKEDTQSREQPVDTYISVPVNLPIETIGCSIGLFLSTKRKHKVFIYKNKWWKDKGLLMFSHFTHLLLQIIQTGFKKNKPPG